MPDKNSGKESQEQQGLSNRPAFDHDLELLDYAKEKKFNKQGTDSGVASKDDVDKVLNYIADKKYSKTKATMTEKEWKQLEFSCAVLVQQGATSPKFAETRTCELFGPTISVKELRAGCSNAKITVRSFARGIKEVVIKVSKHLEIEGNLSKAYKLEVPNHDRQDLPWVSDFQTFNEDPAMPDHIRTWLLRNYIMRFKPNVNPS